MRPDLAQLPPRFLRTKESAEFLGLSKQRASAIQTRADFPAPVAVLRSGPVWRHADVARFSTVPRKPGRPRKVTGATTPPN